MHGSKWQVTSCPATISQHQHPPQQEQGHVQTGRLQKDCRQIINDNYCLSDKRPPSSTFHQSLSSTRIADFSYMLSLLLLYAITQSAFGEVIPESSIEKRYPSVCGDLIQTRTVWNIIWSCLSTIFICTWGSLHPNISSTPDEPGMRWRDKLRKSLVELLRYKLPLFIWALLVPEYILAWAIRQYLTAGEIRKRGAIFTFV
jgi:hypothetical protein